MTSRITRTDVTAQMRERSKTQASSALWTVSESEDGSVSYHLSVQARGFTDAVTLTFRAGNTSYSGGAPLCYNANELDSATQALADSVLEDGTFT